MNAMIDNSIDQNIKKIGTINKIDTIPMIANVGPNVEQGRNNDDDCDLIICFWILLLLSLLMTI